MKRKHILTAVRIVLVCIIVLAGVNVVRIYNGYRKGQRFYEDLRSAHVSLLEAVEAAPRADGADSADVPTSEAPSCPISVDFDALKAENSEIVCWLYSPDGKINYPVTQAADNNKYLRHDLYGNYLVSGTLFADCACAAPGECKNYVIYGHNMDDGTMFGSLLGYKKQSYYDAQPTLYCLTAEKNYKIELLTGGIVDSGSLIYDCTADSESLRDFIEELHENGTFTSADRYSEDDRLITLSTCTYEYSTARFIVIGRLVELD